MEMDMTSERIMRLLREAGLDRKAREDLDDEDLDTDGFDDLL